MQLALQGMIKPDTSFESHGQNDHESHRRQDLSSTWKMSRKSPLPSRMKCNASDVKKLVKQLRRSDVFRVHTALAEEDGGSEQQHTSGIIGNQRHHTK